MLKRTNVNITDGESLMPYLIEYLDSTDEDNSTYSVWYHIDDDKHEVWLDIDYEKEHEHLYTRENYWEILDREHHDNWSEWNQGGYADDMPIAKMKIYFPQYSVDTYSHRTYYIIKTITYLQDWKINIGCYLMNRIESLACAPVRYLDTEFYEYQSLNIPDIWAIIYGPEFKSLRQIIFSDTHQYDPDINEETNDDCSLLSVEIIPANKEEDYYIKHEKYFSSENAIEISKGDSDFMNLTIKQSFNPVTHVPQIYAKLNFNDTYHDILADYLIETYAINSARILEGKYWVDYCITAMNEDDIFKMKLVKKQIELEEIDASFAEFYGQELYFETWSYLEKNIHWSAIACITYRENEDDDGEVLMEIRSNDLPITQEIYRWWFGRNTIDSSLNHINITNDDMNILACNKIVKNIMTLPRPDNYKANIMKPVFFKTYDVEQIYIYSNANCNVSINLTKYYSQVEFFKIQIGGFVSQEYGRNATGVLFKIQANELDKSLESGIYYILDENDEVISDGKYIFKDLMEKRLAEEQAAINKAETEAIAKAKAEAAAKKSKPLKIIPNSSTLKKKIEIVTKKNDYLIPKSVKEKANPIKLASATRVPNKIKKV